MWCNLLITSLILLHKNHNRTRTLTYLSTSNASNANRAFSCDLNKQRMELSFFLTLNHTHHNLLYSAVGWSHHVEHCYTSTTLEEQFTFCGSAFWDVIIISLTINSLPDVIDLQTCPRFRSSIKTKSEGKAVDWWRHERYRSSTALVDWLLLIMRKVYHINVQVRQNRWKQIHCLIMVIWNTRRIYFSSSPIVLQPTLSYNQDLIHMNV